MSIIKITGSNGTGNCDDCGFYGWEHYKVIVDGKEILTHDGDDHLGGNMWFNWETAVTDILTAMGYSVSIELEYEE
jgi:hypothetical protein